MGIRGGGGFCASWFSSTQVGIGLIFNKEKYVFKILNKNCFEAGDSIEWKAKF